jgi:hypothetical protein
MKCTLLLIILTSAAALDRKQHLCIQRCNQLPFKVAISARRASCIEGCNATAAKINADSILRDAKCVKKCNARKTPHRRTIECIERCPEIAAALNRKESAKTMKDVQNEATRGKTIAVTKDGMEMHPHPSLPMLNISEASVDGTEDPEHPSLPMLALNKNTDATDS